VARGSHEELNTYKLTKQKPYIMYKINEYFQGKVVSVAHKGSEGNATVGVMAAGEYDFGTSTVEIMTIVSGQMKVKLPGEEQWTVYRKFESFRVEKDVTFKVSVEQDTPYLCVYL
jgi:purine/pyrimidine-nucleoside phosphorylase